MKPTPISGYCPIDTSCPLLLFSILLPCQEKTLYKAHTTKIPVTPLLAFRDLTEICCSYNLLFYKISMRIYRTVSRVEMDDFRKHRLFRTARNTLEAKQFFKSETGVLDFIRESRRGHFYPPYEYIFHVDIDETCFSNITYAEQEIDRFKAITVQEEDLPRFNNCINFTGEYVIPAVI
jgi:hypothetical protein